MDRMPNQGSSGADQPQNIDALDDIILGGYEQWGQVSSQCESTKDRSDMNDNNDVSVWLRGQSNSQLAQDTFINSQSLPQRKHETQKILGVIDDVFRDTIKPSSTQTANLFNNTAPGLRNPTTSDSITTPINQQLLNEPAIAVPHVQQFLNSLDGNPRCYDDPYYGERPSSTLAPQSHSAFPVTSRGHQASGYHGQSTGPSLQRTTWSVTGTDTSAGSRKLPKRQNSHSTDDDTSSKRTFPRRNRSEFNSVSFRDPQPSSSGPDRTTQLGGNTLLRTPTKCMRVPRQQFSNNASPLVSQGSSPSGTQQTNPLSDRADRILSHEKFNDVCEICPFWLYDPAQFSNAERQACYGRKEELSHVITHLADHHGLVRGKDPKNSSRKYLTSCQTHDPFVKAKGDCIRCNSLHKWKDSDFANPKHKGVVLCLRCWSKFDKREMQGHLSGPMCSYNAEQPKPKKMCILYTTFCSRDKHPSPPPRNMAPRRTKPRSASKRNHRRNAAQQVESGPTHRPASEQASKLLRPTYVQPPYSRVQSDTAQESPLSASSQTQSFVKRDFPTSHESQGSQNEQPALRDPSTRQQSNIQQQSNNQPIAFIYPDTPLEYILSIYKGVQRDQQASQSTYSFMGRPSSSGKYKIKNAMVDNGSQQRTQSQLQNGMRLPNQYQNWQQSFFQLPQSPQLLSQTLGQISQRGLRDKSFDQFSEQSLAQPQYSQRFSDQHPLHEYHSTENHQRSSVNTNLSTFNGGNPQPNFSSNTPQLHLQVPSMNDLDTTISLSTGLSQVQSSPSRVPSTSGESMCLLKSPNIDEPLWWLKGDYEDDDASNWLNFETVGSHPQLQESVEMGDIPVSPPSNVLRAS